jgi:hypothetical protein
MSSFAAIVAAAATIFAAYQTVRVHQQSRTIAIQKQQLQEATSKPTPTGTTQPGGGSSAHSAVLNQNRYLSVLQPTVSNGNPSDGPETISADSYPNSVTFGCEGAVGADQPDVAYDIAGSHVLTAVVGIPDNTPNATGVAETVIFANQNGEQLGKPVVVSLGTPARVKLNVTGVTQLAVTCTGVDEQTRQSVTDQNNPVTLADAGVS